MIDDDQEATRRRTHANATMSMVELLNSDEFAKVERCLRDAVDCAAQRVGAGSGQRSGAWTDNEIFTMRNRLLQMQENVLHKLRLGVDCSGLSEHAVNRNGELVLFSGHAYDRRCEEEIARLESEANALASELEACRAAVPAAVAERLRDDLRRARPSATMPEADGASAPNAAAASISQKAAGLEARLADASARLPSTRAKVEEAVARTARVVRTVQEESARGLTPKSKGQSLHKLLADSPTPTGAALPSGSGDEVAASPAILAAERAGHVAARTDWAKHLAMSCPSPITFSLRDAR